MLIRKYVYLVVALAALVSSANAENVAMVPMTGPTTQNLPADLMLPHSDGAAPKGKAWPASRFALDSSGDCIIDKLTGLMWLRDGSKVNNGNAMNQADSFDYVRQGNWCGYSDWRVPNINEMRSLINYTTEVPAVWLMVGTGVNADDPHCDGACFTNIKWAGTNDMYLTSTTEHLDQLRVYMVNLETGGMQGYKAMAGYVLPVRGGK